MKDTWKALIYLIISALIYKFVGPVFKGFFEWFSIILWVLVLWGFGYLLSPSRKKK